MQKAKWLSEEALQIAEKRKDVKGKGEEERYKHLNAEFQSLANAGDTGSTPGPGRFHMPSGKSACVPQLLSP